MSDLENLIATYASRRLTRHAFVRRLMALGVGVGFAETLLGPGGAREALAAAGRQFVPSRAPYFVLVVLDGFRADYLDLAPMHHLHWLMSRGATYSRAWVGHLESYTPASHATLSTGATPAHQGVIGFSWRDPQTGQEDYTGWYDDVMAGRLELQLQQHGVNSIPLALKKSDPNARVVALSSEKYYAADAMGGPAADFIVFGHEESGSVVTRGIPHHLPPDEFMQLPNLKQPLPLRFGQFDTMAMTMALESLRPLDPRILMVNLPSADLNGHHYGGPARLDVMRKIARNCDYQLGRLFAALRDRGILDQTIFVVTADHGMVQNTYQIDDAAIKAAIREAGGDYLFHVGGNSAYIWLRNPAAVGQVAQHLVDTLLHAPFAHYQTIESGKYVFHPIARTGTSIDPVLETAYQYLLDTFAGPIAPDIALSFEEDTITRVYSSSHGEHGGATWGAQQVPLVIAGPGVRRGAHSQFPARLMDVAPTVLTLLGLEPTNMDGVVLADALVAPTSAQERAQGDLRARLTAYQEAIIARSQADMAAQRASVHPRSATLTPSTGTLSPNEPASILG